MSSAIDYDFNKPADIPIPAKMMNLHIPDRQSLYNCYMPFLEHGGLFIATNVAWINFAISTAVRPKGIGVAFGKDEICINTKNMIEKQLGTALRSERATFTL